MRGRAGYVPLDLGDGEPQDAFVRVEHVRVERSRVAYDVEAAARAVAGLPDELAACLRTGGQARRRVGA